MWVHMRRLLRNLWPIVVIAASLLAATAQAQQYPNRPVRVLVGFAAGSGPDVLARAVANQLGADLGQNFFVENRTGANGTIAIKAVIEAQPDGYTLLYSSASIAPVPHVYKLPYDLVRDLTPIATIGILDGYLMLVNPATSINSVSEFIAFAKNNRALYGSAGVGNVTHLAAEMFNLKAGLAMEHIPYRGTSEVATALLAGNIHTMFVTPPSVLGLAKDGRLRPLASTGEKSLAEFPQVPVMKDLVPGYGVLGSWGMFYAPAKTPPPIIEKLNAAIRQALKVPSVADVVQRAGYEPDGRSAAETAEFFRQEIEAAGEVVRAANIKLN
jgi:tripartite-type tricarboxylate transporter receptor subunit TctC